MSNKCQPTDLRINTMVRSENASDDLQFDFRLFLFLNDAAMIHGEVSTIQKPRSLIALFFCLAVNG